MKNFFREDLKLNKKWWHRALKVARFIGLFIAFIICGFVFYFRYDSELYLPTRVYVGPISDRTNNDVKDITSLIKDGEYLSFRPFSYGDRYNIKDDLITLPKGMGWCSNKRGIKKLIQLKNDNKYIKYINDATSMRAIDYEQVENEINQPCIFNVLYNNERALHYNSGTIYIYYINYPNKYVLTLMWILKSLGISLLFMGAYIILTILLYYKGILYIIYGDKK